MIQNVVFDLDGTLLDTLKDLAAAGNYTLSALGLPVHPVQSYRHMVGNGIPKLVERMLPPQNRGQSTHALALDVFNKYYAAHMQDLTAPYPGIMKMLENLAGAGVHMGVATNKADALARPMVEAYFPHFFQSVVGLREGFAPKPDPASVQQVMQQLGAAGTGTVYVGDSDVDMHTARNARLPAIGVLWGFRDAEELQREGAHLLADTPEGLQKAILQPPEALLHAL